MDTVDRLLGKSIAARELAERLVSSRDDQRYCMLGFWRDPMLPTVFVFIDYDDEESRKFVIDCGIREITINLKNRHPQLRFKYIKKAFRMYSETECNMAIFFPKMVGSYPLSRRAALMIKDLGYKMRLI